MDIRLHSAANTDRDFSLLNESSAEPPLVARLPSDFALTSRSEAAAIFSARFCEPPKLPPDAIPLRSVSSVNGTIWSAGLRLRAHTIRTSCGSSLRMDTTSRWFMPSSRCLLTSAHQTVHTQTDNQYRTNCIHHHNHLPSSSSLDRSSPFWPTGPSGRIDRM